MDNKRLDNLWPLGIEDFPIADLRSLSDREFYELRRLVAARAKKHTGSSAFSKRISRQLLLMRRTEKRKRFTKRSLLSKYQDSELLTALIPERAKKWKSIVKRRKTQKIDVVKFSFLDDPERTFETLQKIASAECECAAVEVDFGDDYVLDIAPYLVLGMMRQKMAYVLTGGSITEPVRKVIHAVGLREFLQMSSFGHVPIDEVWPLPIIHRRAGGTTTTTDVAAQPTTVEKVADRIASLVDEWLEKLAPPVSLTEYGLSKIKGFVGEVLNNAERHGRLGGDGEWIAAGFMARREFETETGSRLLHVCHLSFFNPGRSISDSIKEAPDDIRQQIGRFQNLHSKSGISPETLATVLALQDGISRVPQGNGQPSGGTGIMDIVEFTNEVGTTPVTELSPRVAILSDRAYILFNGQYGTGVSQESDPRRLQWFNPSNSAMDPPDMAYVKDMPVSFPGTIITMRFVIDDELETVSIANE